MYQPVTIETDQAAIDRFEGGAQYPALVLDLLVRMLHELEKRDHVHAEVAVAEGLADRDHCEARG